MASFVTRLEGHKTLSSQSVRVLYRGYGKEVEITGVFFLDHNQTHFDQDLKTEHPECWDHLWQQAMQDSIENAGETVQT